MQHNKLLASLPRKSYRALLPDLTAVTLVFGDILYESGERIRAAHDPRSPELGGISADP